MHAHALERRQNLLTVSYEEGYWGHRELTETLLTQSRTLVSFETKTRKSVFSITKEEPSFLNISLVYFVIPLPPPTPRPDSLSASIGRTIGTTGSAENFRFPYPFKVKLINIKLYSGLLLQSTKSRFLLKKKRIKHHKANCKPRTD